MRHKIESNKNPMLETDSVYGSVQDLQERVYKLEQAIDMLFKEIYNEE